MKSDNLTDFYLGRNENSLMQKAKHRNRRDSGNNGTQKPARHDFEELVPADAVPSFAGDVEADDRADNRVRPGNGQFQQRR